MKFLCRNGHLHNSQNNAVNCGCCKRNKRTLKIKYILRKLVA